MYNADRIGQVRKCSIWMGQIKWLHGNKNRKKQFMNYFSCYYLSHFSIMLLCLKLNIMNTGGNIHNGHLDNLALLTFMPFSIVFYFNRNWNSDLFLIFIWHFSCRHCLHSNWNLKSHSPLEADEERVTFITVLATTSTTHYYLFLLDNLWTSFV